MSTPSPEVFNRAFRETFREGCLTFGVFFPIEAFVGSSPTMQPIAAAVDDIARMPREACVTSQESPEVRPCTFGDLSSSVTVVLFGDSHAVQWFNPLSRIAESQRWKLVTMLKSACPAADVTSPGANEQIAANCRSWRADAIRRIGALRPALVMTGNASLYLVRRMGRSGVSPADWQEGMRRTLSQLGSHGMPVVNVRDNPRFAFDVPTCLARSKRISWYPGGNCDQDQATSLLPGMFEAEKAAARGLSNVHFIDFSERFCRSGRCQAVEDGVVMYRDNQHLTGRYADVLMPALQAELLRFINPSSDRSGVRNNAP